MSQLGFKYYKVPDQIDNVCYLANELFFSNNVKNIRMLMAAVPYEQEDFESFLKKTSY